MITTEIIYMGRDYSCRIVRSNEGEELIIAGTSLFDVLMPYPATDDSDSFVDKETEKVAEEIFFYTVDMPMMN